MIAETKKVAIGEVVVTIDGPYVETRFPDGSICRAFPEDTEEYRKTAVDLGYGDDLGGMCRDHEIAHSLIAEAKGDPFSPTLHAVAHSYGAGTIPREWIWQEEDQVIRFQRFLNGGPPPAGDLDWQGLKEKIRLL